MNMLMTMNRFAAALLVTALAAGCGSALTVQSGVDSGATLAGHSTFELGPADATPEGFTAEAVTPEVSALAQKHIEQELTARGYRKAENADIVVRLSSGRRKVENRRIGEAESTETQGALFVELFDRQTQKRLYHASATDVVPAGKVKEAQIQEAVRRMLEALPPAK